MFETNQAEEDDKIDKDNNVSPDHPGTSTFGGAQDIGLPSKKGAIGANRDGQVNNYKIEVEAPPQANEDRK